MRTGKAAVRSAKLNSGQDFSVESGRVSVKRWVFATAPPSPPFFLSFLVGNLEADVDPAPSAADPETSVVRAIRLGSLIWLALSCLPLPRAGSPFLSLHSPHWHFFFFFHSISLWLFSHQVCVCVTHTAPLLWTNFLLMLSVSRQLLAKYGVAPKRSLFTRRWRI